MAADHLGWGDLEAPYAGASLRSSACPGKVGSGFPTRTCAKPKNRIRIRPDRMRPVAPAPALARSKQPRHRLHGVAAGEDGRRERALVETQMVREHPLHDRAQ